MKQIKILVSHPGKQHVHHLLWSLQKNGYDLSFYTTFWYLPHSVWLKLLLRFLPNRLSASFRQVLQKRHFDPLNTNYIHTFPYIEIVRQSLKFLKSNPKVLQYVHGIHDAYVARRIKKIKPDIVIGYETSSLKTFTAAKEMKALTIMDLASVHFNQNKYLHNTFEEYNRMVKDEIFFKRINDIKEKEYLLTDFFITLSNYAKSTLTKEGVENEKIFKVNLGFDPSTFQPKLSYHSYKEFNLLFVGRISKIKGIKLLLDVFKDLHLDNAKLILVGPEDDAAHYLEEIDDNMEYHPYLPHSTLVNYYQNADIFITPSYTDSWAMTVLESMACGTPVIVSDNTGAKEAVIKGGGLVFPTGNAQALAQSITYLYENRNVIEEMGRKAVDIARNYTWNGYYERVQEVIRSIIDRRNLIYL